MSRFHLFNPENDIALGLGVEHYNPGREVLRFHRDGAALPLWYAEPGDCFYAPDVSGAWLETMSKRFGLDVVADMSANGREGVPWGWSLDARRQLSELGAGCIDVGHVEHIRELSHRRITVDVMSHLHEHLGFSFPPIPIEAYSVDEALSAINVFGDAYVKSPWSSSGRGVFATKGLAPRLIESRISGTISRQGSVIVEKALDKEADFAVLFYSDGVDVRHVGYSVFFNDHGCAYGGNVVASDDLLLGYLSRKVDVSVLQMVVTSLETVLTKRVATIYKGYLGVDMMALPEGEIAPCVEVNLRMTMGVVAWKLAKNILADGAIGVYRVTCQHQGVDCNDTSITESGRMTGGRLPLVPVTAQSRFAITLEASDGLKLL